jgi:ATP-dependent Clp protease adaptor protein ClpS
MLQRSLRFVKPFVVSVQSVEGFAFMLSGTLQVAVPDAKEDLDTNLEDALEPNCRVLIHNDDVTPFDFVIAILRRIFQLQRAQAEHVTYLAHTIGMAHVTTLPCPEANARVGKAHFAASLEGYPLLFTVEPES